MPRDARSRSCGSGSPSSTSIPRVDSQRVRRTYSSSNGGIHSTGNGSTQRQVLRFSTNQAEDPLMTRGPGPHGASNGDPTRAFSTRGAVSPGRDTYSGASGPLPSRDGGAIDRGYRWEGIMGTEILSYSQLGDRPNCSDTADRPCGSPPTLIDGSLEQKQRLRLGDKVQERIVMRIIFLMPKEADAAKESDAIANWKFDMAGGYPQRGPRRKSFCPSRDRG
jgi:hypothetical protein